jgi:MoaA/NifB/PqqE/SkfB family radical SAM enzyme
MNRSSNGAAIPGSLDGSAAPSPTLQYDIEADWNLLHTCNFRCDYCFFSAETLGSRLQIYADPDGWARAFASTDRTWLLHITGGEPTIYPRFTELCERLSERHFLSINTNLSRPVIEDFIDRIDPGRIHFINAALHVDERLKRGGLDRFVARVKALRQAGFFVMVSLVMTPDRIADYPVYEEFFGSHGLALHPKVLRGNHAGRSFPDSYTPGDRILLHQYIARAAALDGAGTKPMGEAATIDLFTEACQVDGRKDYRGQLCASGSRFVRIEPDGSVLRCGTSERLGNLLEENLRLLSAPRVCDTRYCPYFCEKYTQPQFLGVQSA